MSLTLKGGPVEGHYMCQRAPYWLRAVVAADGKRDVLDQLEDEPAADETIYVYRRVGQAGHVHLNMADRRKSGFYALAEYEFREDVDGELLRDTNDWREWASDREPAPKEGDHE